MAGGKNIFFWVWKKLKCIPGGHKNLFGWFMTIRQTNRQSTMHCGTFETRMNYILPKIFFSPKHFSHKIFFHPKSSFCWERENILSTNWIYVMFSHTRTLSTYYVYNKSWLTQKKIFFFPQEYFFSPEGIILLGEKKNIVPAAAP